MNSELIRKNFGNYGIDVLLQSHQQRVSNLYSLQLGKKITRTLAVVSYPDSIPAAIVNENAKIQYGQSIGEVFKTNGWQIEKFPIYIGEKESSPDYDGVYALMGGIEPINLALHIYKLIVSKGNERYNYVQIAEIHHPDYLNIAALKQIYRINPKGPALNREHIQSSLDEVTRVLVGLQ